MAALSGDDADSDGKRQPLLQHYLSIAASYARSVGERPGLANSQRVDADRLLRREGGVDGILVGGATADTDA